MNQLNLISSAKINIDEPHAVSIFTGEMERILDSFGVYPGHDIVLLCIGTDRSTGDCLGPLIGSKISENNYFYRVFGTLDNPVHAGNLEEVVENIKEEMDNPFIIALDACLGKLDSVGNINVKPGPLQPGAGVNKELKAVGHLNITGIVNVGGFMEYLVLQNTRLSLVMRMADIITAGLIKYALERQYEEAVQYR